MSKEQNFSSEEVKSSEVDNYNYQEVYFNQPDLDSIGVLFLHQKAGLCRLDIPLNVSRGDVSEEILNNPVILCIEVGGSGRIQEGNFDHHGEDAPSESATLQAYKILNFNDSYLEKLVSYIQELDTLGCNGLINKRGRAGFPTLSDIIAGIRLKYSRDPVMVMKEGVRVLEELTQKKIDPYGTIPGFEEYAEIKKQNDEEVEKVKNKIKWGRTKNNLIFGYVESEFGGSLGAVYESGKEKFGQEKIIIGVVLNPQFGPEKIRKYTIGLSINPQESENLGINLRKINDLINSLESGWGGPSSGTIIGSPRDGSNLSMEEIIKIIEENL